MGPVSTGPCLHPMHEGLGSRAFVPDRIQGDAVFAAYVIRGPVQDHVSLSIARSIVPPIKSRAGLAAVKAWPGYNAPCGTSTVPASLDRGCARRSAKLWSGRRNVLGRTKKQGVRYACLLTSKAPYKDGLSAAIPIIPIRRTTAQNKPEPTHHPNPQGAQPHAHSDGKTTTASR